MLPKAFSRPSTWIPALAALAFVPSLFSGFVYDDTLLISENEYAQSLEHLGRAFRTHFFDIEKFGSRGIGLYYYRPLVTLSFLLNWLVSGGAAWPFHLVNIALHVACVALAVQVAERWTRNRTVAVLAGLVFALHSSRTESVIWVVGRTDTMAALLLLAGVQCAARAAVGRRATWSVATVAAGIGAILCKESAVLFPVLLGLEALARERASGERRVVSSLAVGTALVSVAYLVVRASLLPVRDAPLEVTPLHGLATIGLYAERILFPWPQTFFFSPLEALKGDYVYSTPHVVVGGIVATLLAWLSLRWIRPKPIAAACLAAAALFLGPLLNFTYTGIFVSTSDHFLYLPLWLLTLGLATGFERAVTRIGPLRVARLGVTGACIAWAAVDGIRALEMQNNETLWARELEINPDNPFVLREVATLRAGEGRLGEAMALNARSLGASSVRYALLAGQHGGVEVYTRVLAMDAALTPDGDVRRLRAIFHELDALTEGRTPERTSEGTVLEYELKFRIEVIRFVLGKRYVKSKFAAEAALVGSRLGRDQDVRRLLAYVADPDLRFVANAANLVLAHARIGDWAGAERRIRFIEDERGHRTNILDDGSLATSKARLAAAREKSLAAERADEAQRRFLLGAVRAETGAFLRALRTLRPLYEQTGPGSLPQYVDLLVAAGLHGEATAELARLRGADAARAEVEGFVRARARDGIERRAAPEPSPWWPPGAGEVP